MAVIHPDFKQLLRVNLEEFARHHPDDSGMGHNQYSAQLLALVHFDATIKEGKDSLQQILKALCLRWPEAVNLFATSFKFQGYGFSNLIKGLSIPRAHIDFIESVINLNILFRADKRRCFSATFQFAGINSIKPNL